MLIDAYGGLGDLKGASRSVEQLLDLRGGSVALAASGAVYRERGWREDAAATLTEAAAYATTPVQKADCLRQLGDLAWDRGEPAEALAQHAAALRTDPGGHAALAGKARAELALGRTAAARHDYAAAVARLPRPEYLLELGELYESLGLGADARAQYARLRARAASDDGHGVSDALVLGRFEADHGAPESAVERLRAQWRRAPNAAVADALGWALYRAGESEEGLVFAKQAAEKGAGARCSPTTGACWSASSASPVRRGATWRRRCGRTPTSRPCWRRGRGRRWRRWESCRRGPEGRVRLRAGSAEGLGGFGLGHDAQQAQAVAPTPPLP